MDLEEKNGVKKSPGSGALTIIPQLFFYGFHFK